MQAFHNRDGQLFAEGVALSAIAERFGTPTYVYSRAHIEAQYRAYADALAGMPHLVCFAVKANSNLGVLNVLARLGAGFDIVSRGELERVLAAGGEPGKIVFSGVGKTRDDMRRALEVGVHCFNVESVDELERLQLVAAELGKTANISLRVNPDGFLDAQHCGRCADGDWERFCDLLRELADTPLGAELGRNGQDYIRYYHDIETIIRQYKEMFAGLMEKGGE